jgi:colanic acid/amylovoran biosynthesis glycosyltransferase
MRRVAVIISKKHGDTLRFSETFVRVHIERLPCVTIPVMGIPNRRIVVHETTRELFPSRAPIPLGARWLARRFRLSTRDAQDRSAMREFLRRWNIDAVLAEYGPNAVSVVDACNDVGVPLIAHFHGYDAYHAWYLETYAEAYRRLFARAAAVVAVSAHMRAQLLNLGADPARLVVNPCGADLPDGLAADPGRAPARFVMVGRLTEKKSPLTSIRAFANVGVDGATLDVVGDGELIAESQALVDSLGIADRVTFHGALPHARTLEQMRQARCFIQHSVTATNGDREGTPVSVLEAMGLGLPIVTTRHGGIPDVVSRADLGALVDEHDVDGMADAMRRFALDPTLAARVGRNAREEVLAQWTAEKRVARLWEVIEQAMAERPRGTQHRGRAALNGIARPWR